MAKLFNIKYLTITTGLSFMVLNFLQILSLLRENPSLRVLLDMPGEDKCLAADFVAAILKPSYSVLGSNRREKEELIVVKFREFLLQCVESKYL